MVSIADDGGSSGRIRSAIGVQHPVTSGVLRGAR
ncbi:MAG: hypothetical protein Ct9H300mP12_16370 [Acidimicrobiales bacterium]|nr:MAG: hypothetical protein Ct9H300mP12_16370 [Acidimicrobiales bacterium]